MNYKKLFEYKGIIYYTLIHDELFDEFTIDISHCTNLLFRLINYYYIIIYFLC